MTTQFLRCIALILIAMPFTYGESITEISFDVDAKIDQPAKWMPTVTLRAANSNQSATVHAFWDGGQTWRARFRVTETGQYQWSATSTDAVKFSRQGTVTVTDPAAKSAIRVSDDGTHLQTVDGEPFFWLADTAWNGVLRSTDDQWTRYLDQRQKQGFNVIQFVSTPWRGGARHSIILRSNSTEIDGFRRTRNRLL